MDEFTYNVSVFEWNIDDWIHLYIDELLLWLGWSVNLNNLNWDKV